MSKKQKGKGKSSPAKPSPARSPAGNAAAVEPPLAKAPEGPSPQQATAPPPEQAAPAKDREAELFQDTIPSIPLIPLEEGVCPSVPSLSELVRDATPELTVAVLDRATPVPSSASFDLSDETHTDIAPIGPTEYAGAELSSVGLYTGSAEAPPKSGAEVVPKSGPSVEQLEQQIRELEARLDEMIAGSRAAGPRGDRPHAEPAALGKLGSPDGPAHTTAREVLSSEFYLRQWGRTSMRERVEEVDEFGHDPAYEARYVPLLDFLYKLYFRVEVAGIHHVPQEGRCLLVSNHSGGPLPYDGLMLRTTLRREHPSPRDVRWLAEDFIYHLPFVGAMMTRLGAVRACQENAERLLGQGRLVVVFPEGAKGTGKLYRERYQLQRFGRGGFIRLCLRTHTPIVPCAIVGAEEANPMLYRIEYMAKTLGIPYLPITPTFPALGPVGLLPAPTKWKVLFGEPIRFDGHGAEAADDEILVGRLSERVRATIQSMLDGALSKRRSIWFG
jgi:1-acyl-sn-glycerol-3-phosphate acyltransferase